MINLFNQFTLGLLGLVAMLLLIWGISKKSSKLEFNGNVSIKIDKS